MSSRSPPISDRCRPDDDRRPPRAGALFLLPVLFPRLNGLFGCTSYGAEWEATWSAEQRVTAPGYFRRYFQYAVPARDTSPVVR